MLVAFAKSVQGESHKRRENEAGNISIGRKFPCQDKSFAVKNIVANDGTKFDFVAVCDGHGGAAYFRSERGADFAIEVLKDMLCRNMKRICELATAKEYEKIKTQLSLGLTKRWRERVMLDLQENPISETEYSYLEKEKPETSQNYKQGKELHSIYGCTMIAYFATGDFWYAIQIGDGDFALSYDGKAFELPMPEDDECFLNQTTSLCDDKAVEEFRCCYGGQIPKCVFCSSDGVANSFKNEESLRKKFYLPIYNLFSDAEFPDCKKTCAKSDCDLRCRLNLISQEITSFLPILSRKGSGDDISLAGIVNFDEKRVFAIRYYIRGMKNLGIQSGNNAGIKLLKKAADLGYEKAQFEYGRVCLLRSGQHKFFGQQYLNKSQKYLAEAKENGVSEASILLEQIFGEPFAEKLQHIEEKVMEEIKSGGEQ